MSLTINEIKNRAIKFAGEWKSDSSERAEAQTFWNEFFEVFGLSRRRLASFEKPAIRSSNGKGRIDLFWKGVLIAEHKSKGEDLDKAYSQALDYFYGLKEQELPKYVIVSDFARFRIYNLEDNKNLEFKLEELYKNISYLDFLTGYTKREFKDEDPVNQQAALSIGKLHDVLENNGYNGHQLEVFLVRLLFVLFAEDAGIIQPKGHFEWLIQNKTSIDGRDVGSFIQQIFEILDSPEDKRQSNLDEDLAQLPYINGSLFTETFRIPSFDRSMRDCLLECCAVDWSYISPAIFGSMFQAAMNPKERRNLGAHYTSEKNVLKVIKDLFLDLLCAEFDKCKNNFNKLVKFHDKLANLKFFDPACGCGNFLIITYRELRLLEIEVIKAKRKFSQAETLDLETSAFSRVNVDQLYGIEIEEFPARISEVALWLTDHQMNIRLSQSFGEPYIRLPLKAQPNIHNKNALRIDWNEIIKKEEISFILGNPPFIGKQLRNKQQNDDLELVCEPTIKKNYGVLDYVSAWYIKAADFIKGTNIQTAFVSTNSITQGEQVCVLWSYLLSQGLKINFAHRTFKWTNEAKGGKAAVFCVIIGFSFVESSIKKLYEYETVSSEPHLIESANINPYLIDFENLIIQSRNKPICDIPEIVFGNMPNDGGYLLLTKEEKEALIQKEPNSINFIKPIVSAKEFLNGLERWCIWFNDVPLNKIERNSEIYKRIEAVKQYRLASNREATQKLAKTPYLFGEIRQPSGKYILIPRVSSETRTYIPMGFFNNTVIVSDTCLSVNTSANYYHLGVLISSMHMAWMRQVCGRLEGRYRYSNTIVYNNFPWPKETNKKQKQAMEEAVELMLKLREKYQLTGSTLADLYNPLLMPADLQKAHEKINKAVDKCYGQTTFNTELERVKFLFELYKEYTKPMMITENAKPRARKKNT